MPPPRLHTTFYDANRRVRNTYCTYPGCRWQGAYQDDGPSNLPNQKHETQICWMMRSENQIWFLKVFNLLAVCIRFWFCTQHARRIADHRVSHKTRAFAHVSIFADILAIASQGGRPPRCHLTTVNVQKFKHIVNWIWNKISNLIYFHFFTVTVVIAQTIINWLPDRSRREQRSTRPSSPRSPHLKSFFGNVWNMFFQTGGSFRSESDLYKW